MSITTPKPAKHRAVRAKVDTPAEFHRDTARWNRAERLRSEPTVICTVPIEAKHRPVRSKDVAKLAVLAAATLRATRRTFSR